MNVILLEKVGRIGNVGDKVNVKAGYARNFLFPFAKAVPATKENVEEFEKRREELVKAAEEKLAAAQARADKINGATITIEANAGEGGKLFGSVGTRDIADALKEAGHDVQKSEVLLPEGALRETGEYQITLGLAGGEVTAEITLIVTALGGGMEEQEEAAE